jgi:hypothetical protein
MDGFGALWKRCAASQKGAEVVPSLAVGGHPSRLQHNGMVVVLVQYVSNMVHDGEVRL